MCARLAATIPEMDLKDILWRKLQKISVQQFNSEEKDK